MTERPILFNGEMVRALLDGRKSQTRRVVKPQPPPGTTGALLATDGSGDCKFYSSPMDGVGLSRTDWKQSPYGAPGDRLYVRETWQVCPDCGLPNWRAGCNGQPDAPVCQHCDASLGNWKPSIHMWKDYARIWLEVTGVKVERVKSIHYADARAEGVFCASCNGYHDRACTCKRNFRRLWDTINAKRGYGWDMNPWVWVIEFKRTQEAP